VTSLSEKVADELGLPESRVLTDYFIKDIEITGTGSKVFPSKIVTVNKLCLNDVEFKCFDAMVQDFSERLKPGSNYDGVLGFRMFRDYLLTIDFPKEHLKLERGKLQRCNKPLTIPAEISGGTYKIPVTIGVNTPKPNTVKCTLDTGYNGCMLLPLRAKEYDIPSNLVGETRVSTAAETFTAEQLQLETEVLVGDATIIDPIVSYIGKGGTIGNRVLRHYVITFDQKHKLVRIVLDRQSTNVEN